jgi:hypothetical protein
MRELETEIDALRTPPKRRIAIACEMLQDEVNEEIRQMYIETSASADTEYSEKEKNIPIAYFNLFCKDEEARAMAIQEVIDDADKKHKLDIPTESQIHNKLTRIWIELATERNEKYKSHMFCVFGKFFPEEECEEE